MRRHEEVCRHILDRRFQSACRRAFPIHPATSFVKAGKPALTALQRAALVSGLALLCLLIWPHESAAQSTERSRQKQAAEAQHAALRQKLAALKREIHQTETAKEHAADALAASEAAISDANRSLRELAEEQKQVKAKLAKLTKTRAEVELAIEKQQQQLSRLLREQYTTGNEDRFKLLLSGDNPNRINRDMRYMGYISEAQARLLDDLRHNLAAVEKNRIDAESMQRELDEIVSEEKAQKALLEKEKAKRVKLLSSLSDKLSVQRVRAENIERDEQRLANLVNKLGRLIKQQRAAEKEQQARPHSSPNDSVQKRASKQEDAVIYNRFTPDARTGGNAGATPFRNLRGKLRLPVKGELVAKYGNRRGDGPSWKGLFIRTEEGSEVKSVADGQIVFADWLRGFGNLVIIDHGDQYLTIYGNNQSVLKRIGDNVKAGEVIASTGNSGGVEQSGLYFEMRHDGRPFDPLEWVTIR